MRKSSHLIATSGVEPSDIILESPHSVDIPLAQLARGSGDPDPTDNESPETFTSSPLTEISEDLPIMDQQNVISESGKADSISSPACETSQASYSLSPPIVREQWDMQLEGWDKDPESPRCSMDTHCIHHLPTTLDRSMELPPIHLEHPTLELALPKPTLPALSLLLKDVYDSYGSLGMLFFLVIIATANGSILHRLFKETWNRRNAEVIPPQYTT
jgi:hypothetical protein